MMNDFEISDRNRLRSNDPYSEAVEIIINKTNLYDSYIVWIYTDNTGYSVEFLECYEFNFTWGTDWYEGGNAYLLAFCPLSELKYDKKHEWEGTEE